MIDKIHFKNYKIFKEKQSLELRPITVLIGKNNSGKSAVAKLPTLIEGVLENESNEVINFKNNGIELGGEFRDLIYGRTLKVLEFEIDFKQNEFQTNHKLSVGIFLTMVGGILKPKIDFWKFDDEVDLHYTNKDSIYHNEVDDENYACSFRKLKLDGMFYVEKRDGTGTIPNFNIELNTDYIGPIRTKPERDYRITTVNEKFGIAGENAYQFLIQDSNTTERKLINDVSIWYQKNCEGWSLKVNQDKAPIYQIELTKGDLNQNILDTGIGMNQVLPLVTRAFMPCEKETLIIIEEPETHLHPAAHGSLAELFVQSLLEGKKRYLIETHSQNFVLRLRRLVAQKKLNKDDLAIYYIDFDEKKDCSVLEKIEVDEFGRVNKWPDGVFSETLSETIGIRTAQLDNPKYGN